MSGDCYFKICEGVMIGVGVKIFGNIEVGCGVKIGVGFVVLQFVLLYIIVVGVLVCIVGKLGSDKLLMDMDQYFNGIYYMFEYGDGI